jgi:hypothetical protein
MAAIWVRTVDAKFLDGLVVIVTKGLRHAPDLPLPVNSAHHQHWEQFRNTAVQKFAVSGDPGGG